MSMGFTPARKACARGTFIGCMSLRYISYEMHALIRYNEMHAYEAYTYEMYIL